MRQQLTEILYERGSHDLLDEQHQMRKLDAHEIWQSPNYKTHL
jgi:hypothetical protein